MNIENSGSHGKNKRQWKNASKEKAKLKPRKISARYLYNAGLAYLQKFPASSKHFQDVMSRKIDRSIRVHGEPDRTECMNMLHNVTQQFTELGLLDDAAYAGALARSLYARGLAKRAISYKMLQKKVDKDLIETCLSDLVENEHEDGGEFACALRLARRKKIGPYRTKERNDNRELSAMARGGYGYEIARKIIDMADPEDEI